MATTRCDSKHDHKWTIAGHSLWAIGIGLVLALIIFKIAELLALSTVEAVWVELESEHETVAKLYYSMTQKASFSEKYTSQTMVVSASERQRLRFNMNNAIVRLIRLDPGAVAGVYRLYTIEPKSYFGSIAPILPYAPGVDITAGPGTKLVKKSDCLEIRAATDDPWLIVNVPLRANGYYLAFFAAGLTFLATLYLTPRFQITNFRVWQDTFAKKTSSGVNYAALDGFRGVAALLVLAVHTGWPGLAGAGINGVVMFFCLSGYLLTIPYAMDSGKVMSLDYVGNYFARRFRRIVPMYYSLLVVTYLFDGRIADFTRTALFLQGDGVLWAIPQEVHFYLILPFILLLNHLLFAGKKWLIVSWLLALGYCFNHGIVQSYPIYGEHSVMHVFAGLFITGILFCYLQHLEVIRNSAVVRKICGNPVVGILLLVGLFGSHHLWALFHDGVQPGKGWVYWGNYNYLIGFIIFALVMAQDSLLARFFSVFPFRLIGTVSFSFYLLHPIFLRIFKTFCELYFDFAPPDVLEFLVTLILTFAVSVFTYTYIERAFK